MFDLKVINSVLDQLEEERGIPKEKVLEAIEMALATAYKKEYGKRGQIIKANFDINSGSVEMHQVKIVVDDTKVFMDKESLEDALEDAEEKDDDRVLFNTEHHILLPDAQKIKKGAQVGDEIIFPLESKGDYGRIASQTAKQVIMQKIREAERNSVLKEFGEREGEVISGTVQRIERGNIFVDVGRAVASNDNYIDPVGSLVGQRGVRVAAVTSELGGEKIDVIEWSENPVEFIEDALSPAKIVSVEMDEENHQANVVVSEDQQSLAIGKGGQNVRLAAKLTGWRIDIKSTQGEELEIAE